VFCNKGTHVCQKEILACKNAWLELRLLNLPGYRRRAGPAGEMLNPAVA